MTKDVFKALMNEMIREFNKNHRVHISAVIVNEETNEALVLASDDCVVHKGTAAMALASDHLNDLHAAAAAVKKTRAEIQDKIAEAILLTPLRPGEKGA